MDELLKKLMKGAKSLFPAILARYFDRFRVAEFSTAVGATIAASAYILSTSGVPAEKAVYVTAGAGFVSAYLFIRNPKMAEWVADQVEVKGQDDEDRA
jgi:hypothetical protein